MALNSLISLISNSLSKNSNKNTTNKNNNINTNYAELLKNTSDYDKKYSSNLNGILTAKNNYMNATTDADKAYWNNYANNIRKQDGYYSGATGSDLSPVLNLPSYESFNYKDFSYDVDNDPLYQMYSDKYAREGQSAGEKVLANLSSATGGIPSSYAAAANAQTQQAYAQKAADIVPILEQQAYDRYNTEKAFDYQDYLNKLNYDAQNAEAKYNAMWQDKQYGDTMAQQSLDNDYRLAQFEYDKYLNDLDEAYRQQTFDWNKQVDQRNYDYGVSQDSIQNALSWDDNKRLWEQFNYTKQQNELSKEEQEKQAQQEQETAQQQAQQEQEQTETIRLAIADALKSADPLEWLRTKGAYLTSAEYDAVIERLKDLNVLEN
jgi:hypothetical protein